MSPFFKKIATKKNLIIFAIICTILAALSVVGLFGSRMALQMYVTSWEEKLIRWQKAGALNDAYGAAWQEILELDSLSGPQKQSEVIVLDLKEIQVAHSYPSLRIIERLNQVHAYSNKIEIVDRFNAPLAQIRTDHTRAQYQEVPQVLIEAIVAAEDANFFTNDNGYEFNSFVRASMQSLLKLLTEFRVTKPSGTSTITQQVAKLFISDLDEKGQRTVSTSVDRKIKEIKLAATMRELYTPQQIMEVYVNHCITSDYGLIGVKDIAEGLFNTPLPMLSDAQSVYIARMVKWGRNFPEKIKQQCQVDMPRIAARLGWDREKQSQVLAAIDTLTFHVPKTIRTQHGHLIDLANHCWQTAFARNDSLKFSSEELDLISPHSLIRKRGNAKIKLHIDRAVQNYLQELVDKRGFGQDTTITTDVRIGSFGHDIRRSSKPRDTVGIQWVLKKDSTVFDPSTAESTLVQAGESVSLNIRYRHKTDSTYRRSLFLYKKGKTVVDGQYFAYAIINAKTGELLAYYSRDKIGSQCASLFHRRTPNGSSTAKPILNALNFDLGVFEPQQTWDDSRVVADSVAWRRDIVYNRQGDMEAVTFFKRAGGSPPYTVANHGNVVEGCQYIFQHLATSNNILGVETAYRLDTQPFTAQSKPSEKSFAVASYLQRLGVYSQFKKHKKEITGIRLYKEFLRVIGAEVDSLPTGGAISDSMYSVALGTLELSLYEQLHAFNAFYNNRLIRSPYQHISLLADSIVFNNDNIMPQETITSVHPFTGLNTIRPTLLGLHNRLTSNPADQLGAYDMPLAEDINPWDDAIDPYQLSSAAVNFAKSGTTDDILRPFYASVGSREKTNYGLWNATIRIDRNKLINASSPAVDTLDLTIACIGETSYRHTGARDGKSLHKYVSNGFLHKAGIGVASGFYDHYENYLRSLPQKQPWCGAPEPEAQDPSFFRRLFSSEKPQRN